VRAPSSGHCEKTGDDERREKEGERAEAYAVLRPVPLAVPTSGHVFEEVPAKRPIRWSKQSAKCGKQSQFQRRVRSLLISRGLIRKEGEEDFTAFLDRRRDTLTRRHHKSSSHKTKKVEKDKQAFQKLK
jgi:hypothetical protein